MKSDDLNKYKAKAIVKGEDTLKAIWNNNITQNILNPLGMLYGKVAEARNKVISAYKARIPVICVGNLTMGGTGKTPVAIWIAEYLKSKGLKPCFLTRGYKGAGNLGYITMIYCDPDKMAERIGDEATLLLRTAPVVVNADRAKGAREAITNEADVIVMDDGFQNPTLYKDKSLLIFDGSVGIGNGQVFPAGPLRENFELGLRRASAAVIMGEDVTGVSYEIRKYAPDMPIFYAKMVANTQVAAELKGNKVLAFAGIGNPNKFFTTLADIGVNVVQRTVYPDHYKYTDIDLASLVRKAEQLGLTLVTTQKDKVKISSEFRDKVTALPVSVEFNDPTAFKAFLDA